MKINEQQREKLNQFVYRVLDTVLFDDDFDEMEKILTNDESIPIEPPVGVPSETLSCEQVRLNTIEECAKYLEIMATKNNDLLVEERHILQEDTVENFRNDIDFLRELANSLRKLASKP